MTAPTFLWLTAFFCAPLLIITAYAFKPYDIYGTILEGWTLQTILHLCNVELFFVLWRTFWLSSATTAICLLLALPMGYHIATLSKNKRNVMLMLIVIPFWSSFLIRIFAWKSLLHPEGALHRLLSWLNVIEVQTTLLYNYIAVLFVMIYNYLPFAILPIFAAATKFNFNLLEAAIDLGATRWQAFYKIFIPAIKKGLITALLMVFIPAMGTYVIPDIVGGTNSEMLSNKIAQKTFIERSLPQASALSLFLSAAVFIPLALSTLLLSWRQRTLPLAKGRE